jgi:hypothetical protein
VAQQHDPIAGVEPEGPQTLSRLCDRGEELTGADPAFALHQECAIAPALDAGEQLGEGAGPSGEHQAAMTAGQQRVMNLSEVMDRETSELETAMNELRDALSHKMDAAFAALHSKIDPLISQGAACTAIITQVDKRLTRLENEHSNEVGKLHSRIDDAIRTSLNTHPRPAK